MQQAVTILSDDEDDDIDNDKFAGIAKHIAIRRLIDSNDIRDLSSPRMLTDQVINAAQVALKSVHTDCSRMQSLQDTVLGQVLHFQSSGGRPFVQVLHDGNLHWVAVTTYGCQPGDFSDGLTCESRW